MTPRHDVIHRIDDSLALLGENGAASLVDNVTLMQYCVQDMFKKRQIPAIAKSVAKKFSGSENIFLGNGVLEINPKELEAALWQYVGKSVAAFAGKVKPGKEHFAIDGTMQQFNIDPKYRAKVKAAAVTELGRDIFTNDDVHESVTPSTDDMNYDRAANLRPGDPVIHRGELHHVYRIRKSRFSTKTLQGTPGDTDPTYTGPSREIPTLSAAVTLKNSWGQQLKPISFTRPVAESVDWRREFEQGFIDVLGGVSEMAATYVPITRDEFEAWLTEVWGAKNWNIRAGSVGVYRLKLGPKVSLEVSSSIGRADTNMGVGEAAIHVAMVGRVSGRTLNKKATGKSRINRTKGWKANLLAALEALKAAYNESPAFYEAISDPAAYKDETLARIDSIPDSGNDVFWSSLRNQVEAGRVLSDKQTQVLLRRTPDFQYTRLPVHRTTCNTTKRTDKRGIVHVIS